MNEKLKPVIEKMLVKVSYGYSLETAYCLALGINSYATRSGALAAFLDGLLYGTSRRLNGCGWIEFDNQPHLTNGPQKAILEDILSTFQEPEAAILESETV